MDTQSIFPWQSVEAVLSKWPKTYLIFRSRNTDCVGCLLQKFCSIQNVAESYEVPAVDLIHDLKKCVDENYPSQGVSDENFS